MKERIMNFLKQDHKYQNIQNIVKTVIIDEEL